LNQDEFLKIKKDEVADVEKDRLNALATLMRAAKSLRHLVESKRPVKEVRD